MTHHQYLYNSYLEEFKFILYFNTIQNGYNVENTIEEIINGNKQILVYGYRKSYENECKFYNDILSRSDWVNLDAIYKSVPARLTDYKKLHRKLIQSKLLPIIYPYELFENWINDNDLIFKPMKGEYINKTEVNDVHKEQISKIIELIENKNMPEIKYPCGFKSIKKNEIDFKEWLKECKERKLKQSTDGDYNDIY
jgi:hypothetical protein